MGVTRQLQGRPAAAASHLPKLIAGRYRIERHIADGGMGRVYEATDLLLEERVALKTLVPSLLGRARAQARFRREILLARRVTHANVCRVFEVVIEPVDGENVPFVAMELLVGETLADRLGRETRLTEHAALRIAVQVAAGLDCAHRSGIVHRDLKSRNVMLVPAAEGGERAVVCDFGVAAAIQPSSTDLGPNRTDEAITPVGTPAYMAPEQLDATGVTTRADVWAFGVLLYEMVTGRLPFTGRDLEAIALAQLRGPDRLPSQCVPGLSVRWDAVIERCLAIEPDDRYESVEAALSALTCRTAAAGPGRWAIGAVVAAIVGVSLLAFAVPKRQLHRATPVPSVPREAAAPPTTAAVPQTPPPPPPAIQPESTPVAAPVAATVTEQPRRRVPSKRRRVPRSSAEPPPSIPSQPSQPIGDRFYRPGSGEGD